VKVIVLGTGGPAGANTAAALRAAGHRIIGFDGHPLHQSFAWDHAHEMLPELTISAVNATGADAIVAQPDPLVQWLSQNRRSVKPATLLPDSWTLERCSVKPDPLAAWHEQGLRKHMPVVFGPELPDWLHLAKDKFGLPFWLRAARGAGGTGSTLVETLAQGFHWVRYWQERGTVWDWVAEEFLPGRDFSWTGVYHAGTLIASFARERLEYIYPHLSVSGITGTPTVATVVHDKIVNDTAERAVSAVDGKPHGVFNVDMREDTAGVPRPTEINAGRFNTTIGAWRLAGANLPDQIGRAHV
jgi:carbamoyl-phosphate synthase large subunit